MNRKRTIIRLKEKYLISITPIPRVKLKVFYRTDGSYTVYFGYASHDYLEKTGQLWDENGRLKFKGKCSFWGGQSYAINDMWRYIREQAYRNNIHELDLA